VPLYMLPRYQVDAAIKRVGGWTTTFALLGDGQNADADFAPANAAAPGAVGWQR